MVAHDDQPGELVVNCAFAVFANRTNMTSHDVFVGHRRDLLLRRDDDFKLRSRTLWLDQAVVGSNSISVFL
jgi:3-phenylpropionate/cinnamic acid dioxygenase small subunit